MPYNVMLIRDDSRLIASYRAKSYPQLSKDGGTLTFQRIVGEDARWTYIHKSTLDLVIIEEVSDENGLGGGVKSQGVQCLRTS